MWEATAIKLPNLGMVSTHKIGDDLGMLSMAWGESHVIIPSTLNTPYIVINDVYVSYKKP